MDRQPLPGLCQSQGLDARFDLRAGLGFRNLRFRNSDKPDEFRVSTRALAQSRHGSSHSAFTVQGPRCPPLHPSQVETPIITRVTIHIFKEAWLLDRGAYSKLKSYYVCYQLSLVECSYIRSDWHTASRTLGP